MGIKCRRQALIFSKCFILLPLDANSLHSKLVNCLHYKINVVLCNIALDISLLKRSSRNIQSEGTSTVRNGRSSHVGQPFHTENKLQEKI